jgi:hypothetical protein
LICIKARPKCAIWRWLGQLILKELHDGARLATDSGAHPEAASKLDSVPSSLAVLRKVVLPADPCSVFARRHYLETHLALACGSFDAEPCQPRRAESIAASYSDHVRLIRLLTESSRSTSDTECPALVRVV